MEKGVMDLVLVFQMILLVAVVAVIVIVLDGGSRKHKDKGESRPPASA
jgi:hypothetical protein